MSRLRASFHISVLTALIVGLLALLPTSAQADTAPPRPDDPLDPVTVSADALPTVQINGVAWTQLVVGDTVYVGGDFTNARPAGAPEGTSTTPRSNLLAYDINTGQLRASWAPTTDGTVYALAASPDGSRIYVGGSFTSVNGSTRKRIVALDPADGSIVPGFNPGTDATVRAVVATDTTVYLGGVLTAVNNVQRARLAAVRASDGSLLSWAPAAGAGSVRTMDISPDGSRIVVGGMFTSMNGSSNPGYGMALVDSTTGANLPFPGNAPGKVRNGGDNSSITDVHGDGDSFYVAGYNFGGAGGSGNLEGVARFDWDGNLVWVEDCHGDSYGVFPHGDRIYVAGHPHYCGNIPGDFHETMPRGYYHNVAFTKAVTGTLYPEYHTGYFNWSGTPSPSMLTWTPRMTTGTYTGQNQASWTVTGNDDYVVVGGEFPTVNGGAQQGLVRFAARNEPGNPNQLGPWYSGYRSKPTVTSPEAGTAVVCWQTNYDRDNEYLTYNVIRNSQNNKPAYSVTIPTAEWDRPYRCWQDTGQTPGVINKYRIFATDPLGNESRSDTVQVTISDTGTIDSYAKSVLADGPQDFWRFDEANGTNVADYTGLEPLTATAAVGRGTPGVAGNAATFTGSSTSYASNQTARAPGQWFTVEAWIKTTSSTGGKIIGYGSARTGNSTARNNDKHLYMDNAGKVYLGVRNGRPENADYDTVSTPSTYRDGQWHYVAGSVGDDGMRLYVDGTLVAENRDVRSGDPYDGYWRIGGDNLSGWPGTKSSNYFNGAIDEAAVYRHALTAEQIRSHYLASGLAPDQPPADGYGAAVYDSNPDTFWRLRETSGTNAADSSLNGNSGTYLNGVTQGRPSLIGLDGDYSAGFDGVNDAVTQNRQVSAPKVWSAEAWFRTTTNVGGQVLDFGTSSGATTSAKSDRQVVMGDDGTLRAGVLDAYGNRVVLTSSEPYNDGNVHQVVVTQASSGFRLYVDGALVDSKVTATTNSVYSGYWRIGGDAVTGWTNPPTSGRFAGRIDEAAFYSRELSAGEVADHFGAAGAPTANTPPTADFSATVNGRDVSFDGTLSSDPDGSVSSYSWDFGDGTTGTGPNPTHTYADIQDYLVTLTVTDDSAATSGPTQKTVTTTRKPPTAAFTVTKNQLLASFDASTSTAGDGAITAYDWDFGDGLSGTGQQTTHLYALPGSYEVTLTVTVDDDPTITDTETKTVVVSAGPVVTDSFSRNLSNEWGTADSGGDWSVSGTASRYAVTGGLGTMKSTAAGSTTQATLAGTLLDTDTFVTMSWDKRANGGGIFSSVAGRVSGGTTYRGKVKLASNGRVTLYLVRTVNGAETSLGSVLLPASTTYAVGEKLNVRLQIQGTLPTTLRMRAWESTVAEPSAWQLTKTDSTASLQAPGGVALVSYLSGSSTNTPVTTRFDDLAVSTLLP